MKWKKREPLFRQNKTPLKEKNLLKGNSALCSLEYVLIRRIRISVAENMKPGE